MSWTKTATLPATVVTDASVAGVVPSPLTKAAIEAIIAASGGNSINVKDFGALGNGTHDDTANINSAFAAIDRTKNRTIVYIPAGTYMINGVNPSQPESNTRFIDAGLQPLSGTTILMDPDAILKIIPNSSPSYTVFFMGQTKKNITIRGGQIAGDRATHDYATVPDYPTFEFGYGITTRGAKNITVDNVTIYGMMGDCIVFGPYGNDASDPGYVGASGTIRNCTLSDARRNNISIIGADWTVIENNTISGAGSNDGIKDGTAPRMGIDLERGIHEIVANITIRGNRFVGNKNGAVENFNGTGVVIEGNFADTGIITGTHADGDNVIKGNVLIAPTDTTHTGIAVASGLTPGNMGAQISDNIIIGFNVGIGLAGIGNICSGNYVTQFADSGIVSYQGTEIDIVGNHVFDARTGSTGAGIAASAPYTGTNRVAIKSNNVSNTYVGVLLNNAATGVTVDGNTILKGYRGIVVGGGSQGVFKNNVIDLPGHAAGQDVDISYGPTSNVVVIGNTIRNSASYSIQGQSGGTGGVSRILRNTIQDSTSTIALLLTDGAHYVVDNIISVNRSSGSLYGIYIGNAALNSKIIGNTGYATGASPYNTFVVTSAATGTPASTVFGNRFDGTSVVSTHASDIVGENFSSTKTLASLTGTQTLTNKRITPRVVTTTTASTLAIDSDATDLAVRTGQGAALTISAPTGTPTAGQVLSIRIKDDGTARALTWNAAFRSLSATLPTTTVINTPLIVTVRWNEVDSKWDATSAPSVAGGTGDVVGPGSAVSADFATFSGTTGKLIQDSGLALDTDGTLAANSNTKIPSQAAVKTYAQPLDSDLTTIAGLTATTNNMLMSVASAWASRTPAQVKAALAIANTDVSGLGTLATQSGTFSGTSSGTNTGDQTSVTGNAGTATKLATARNINGVAFDGSADITVADSTKQPLDSDLTTIAGLTATTDNVIQSVAGAWASRTMAQLKTALALVKGDVALGNVDNTSDATKNAAAVTLTNKRITKRVSTATSTSTLTPDSDSYDVVLLTAQAAALTIAAPTGTPTSGQSLIIRIIDNATARAITWNAAYRVIGVTLPTTTVVSKTVYVGAMWNSDASKWDVIAVAQEA